MWFSLKGLSSTSGVFTLLFETESLRMNTGEWHAGADPLTAAIFKSVAKAIVWIAALKIVKALDSKQLQWHSPKHKKCKCVRQGFRSITACWVLPEQLRNNKAVVNSGWQWFLWCDSVMKGRTIHRRSQRGPWHPRIFGKYSDFVLWEAFF